MFLCIYNNAFILIVGGDMIRFQKLILEINNLLDSLVGWGALDFAQNISQEQWERFFLVDFEQVLLKNGFEANGAIGVQVGKLLNIEFLDCMEAFKLLPVINYEI